MVVMCAHAENRRLSTCEDKGSPMPMRRAPPLLVICFSRSSRFIRRQGPQGGCFSSYVVLDGAKIVYIDEGRGDALVLVHGWIGSGILWDLMVPELARDFRVVAPDLPGHGDSGIPDGFSFDLQGFFRFLEEMREAHDLPRFTLVGHSIGGNIALNYAARYPSWVSALVLIDTPAHTRSISWSARLPVLEWALGLVHRF